MTDNVYAVTEVIGSSSQSPDDAIRNAIATAGGKLRNLGWFEVSEIRGHIEDGEISHYQVAVKIGFRYETDR